MVGKEVGSQRKVQFAWHSASIGSTVVSKATMDCAFAAVYLSSYVVIPGWTRSDGVTLAAKITFLFQCMTSG